MNTRRKSRILDGQRCYRRERLLDQEAKDIVRKDTSTPKNQKKQKQKKPSRNYSLPAIPPSLLLGLLCIGILVGLGYLLFENLPSRLPSLDLSGMLSEDEVSTNRYTSIPSLHTEKNLLYSELPKSNTLTILEKIKRGDRLSTLLSRVGITEEIATQVDNTFHALKKSKNISTGLVSGKTVEVELHLDGTFDSITIPLSQEKPLRLVSEKGNIIEAPEKKTIISKRERVVIGEVEHSFGSEGAKAGLTFELIDNLVDLFGDRIAFHKDFRKGDRFTVIYDEVRSNEGDYLPSGDIHAAAFQIRGKTFAAIRFVGTDGKGRYFNEKGALMENTFLRYPLKFSRISSHFTTARFHPVLKRTRPHNGVDFAAPTGTPVRTTANGTVTFAGRKGGHGIMVKIKHSDRYTTGYSHLSTIAKGVKRGASVTRGQVIGAVGKTGLATGPHLHFSLYDRGKYVDPLKVDLPQAVELKKGTAISKRYLKRVLFTLNNYQSVSSSELRQ